MFKRRTQFKSDSGQALLFVVVALAVGLAVGVNTALRTFSSVSRISTSDTSSRVLAAAEGGLEQFLAYSSVDLAGLSSECTSLTASDYDEDSPCVITFEPVSTDPITARAVVSVRGYTGDPDDNYIYRVSVAPGHLTTLNLEGYSGSLQVCWSGDTNLFAEYFTGTDIDNWESHILCEGTTCIHSETASSGDVSNGETTSTCSIAGDDYVGYTFNILSTDDVQGLAIIPLDNRAEVAFVPNSEFPNPVAYEIVSKGELLEDRAVKTTRTVRAIKSLPFLPSGFLFGIYSSDGVQFTGDYYETD